MQDRMTDDLKPLTSLRFVAAMMIVGLHLKLSFLWSALAYVPGRAVQGVSFFFVLSGFILTHVYSSRPLPRYRAFMAARISRLWPVHVASLLVLLNFVRADSITFIGLGIFSKPVLLIVNLGLLQAWFPTIAHQYSFNSVSWSISTEMAFYLAFPFLLVRIRRQWASILLLAAGLVIAMLMATSLLSLPDNGGVETVTTATFLYTQPLVRGLEFVTGMAAYVFWNRFLRYRLISAVTYTVMEVSALTLVVVWLARGSWIVQSKIESLPSVLAWFIEAGSFWAFAIVIVIFAAAGGWLGKILSLRPFVWLGEISFSIYMFHLILIKIFALGYPDWSNPQTFFPALIAISALSFYLVEQPGRKWLGRILGASHPSVGLPKTDRGAADPVTERA